MIHLAFKGGKWQPMPATPSRGIGGVGGSLAYCERSTDLIFINIRIANALNPAKFPVIRKIGPASRLHSSVATEIPIRTIAAERKKLIVSKYFWRDSGILRIEPLIKNARTQIRLVAVPAAHVMVGAFTDTIEVDPFGSTNRASQAVTQKIMAMKLSVADKIRCDVRMREDIGSAVGSSSGPPSGSSCRSIKFSLPRWRPAASVI